MNNRFMGYEEVKMLVDATFRIIDSAKRANDPLNVDAEIQFLSLFTEALVSRTLNEKSIVGKSKREHATNVMANFGRLKFGIQESVAVGFQNAMERVSKKPFEYCCIIKPVRDPDTSTSH